MKRIMENVESFSDRAIVLSLRNHLDKGVVISALTKHHGRHAGFAYKSALSGVEIGCVCDLRWEARVSDQLGTFKEIDIDRNVAPLVIGEPKKLAMLQSFCSMNDTVLPEREPHPDLFEASAAFLESLPDIDDAMIAGASYVVWEILLLRSLGYGLDLSQCAATGQRENLIYVSPRTGKAVSEEAGVPYKDKLLTLPPFLRADGRGEGVAAKDVSDGLKLTQTFFEKWVLTHMSAHLPVFRYELDKKLAS